MTVTPMMGCVGSVTPCLPIWVIYSSIMCHPGMSYVAAFYALFRQGISGHHNHMLQHGSHNKTCMACMQDGAVSLVVYWIVSDKFRSRKASLLPDVMCLTRSRELMASELILYAL